MNKSGEFGVGDIFVETFATFGRNWLAVIVYTVVATGLGVVSELAGGEGFGIVADGIVSMALGYFLLWQIMAGEGLAPQERSGIGLLAYFGASILAGLFWIVGFVLLIVPGLILMARWSLVPALVVGRGNSISEAFSESWDLTGERQWTLVGFNAIIMLISAAFVLFLGGGVVLQEQMQGGGDALAPGSVLGVLTEGVGNFVGGLSYCVSVALFTLIVERGRQEEEIFI